MLVKMNTQIKNLKNELNQSVDSKHKRSYLKSQMEMHLVTGQQTIEDVHKKSLNNSLLNNQSRKSLCQEIFEHEFSESFKNGAKPIVGSTYESAEEFKAERQIQNQNPKKQLIEVPLTKVGMQKNVSELVLDKERQNSRQYQGLSTKQVEVSQGNQYRSMANIHTEKQSTNSKDPRNLQVLSLNHPSFSLPDINVNPLAYNFGENDGSLQRKETLKPDSPSEQDKMISYMSAKFENNDAYHPLNPILKVMPNNEELRIRSFSNTKKRSVAQHSYFNQSRTSSKKYLLDNQYNNQKLKNKVNFIPNDFKRQEKMFSDIIGQQEKEKMTIQLPKVQLEEAQKKAIKEALSQSP